MRIASIILFVFSHAISSSQVDTLFLSELKNYIYGKTGVRIEGDFYSTWSEEDKPYIYLYISEQNKVAKPERFPNSFLYYHFNEARAKRDQKKYRRQGYQTFIYKTRGTSAAKINKRLMSYSKEAIAFVVFHEYVHRYISQEKIKIAYEYNEALCDVIANFCCLDFFSLHDTINFQKSVLQEKNNEAIYYKFNGTIDSINNGATDISSLHDTCKALVTERLLTGNEFQKDRFNYEVNNAYLLKNSYYSMNYFLLSEVLEKQKSLEEFLAIIARLPQEVNEYNRFLEKYK